jgi:hypothetical protein
LETYNDYPQGAVNNAKRAIKWKEENGSDCGTQVGWTSAGTVESKRKISADQRLQEWQVLKDINRIKMYLIQRVAVV